MGTRPGRAPGLLTWLAVLLGIAVVAGLGGAFGVWLGRRSRPGPDV